MCRKYALEWLDALITVSLNGEKTALGILSEEHVQTIISKIGEEKDRVQAFLKNQVFSSTKESQVFLLIRQYHAALIILLDQAFENRKMQPDSTRLKPVCDAVISGLDELLSFIEVRFSAYMSLDERVPVTYLSVTKQELKQRVDRLKPRLLGQVTDKQIAGIVLDSLYAFIHHDEEEDHPVTFRKLLYQKDLLRELETLEGTKGEPGSDKALYELLVYKNFNSKAYIDYLTQKFAKEINAHENLTDRLDQLLLHYKGLKQMSRRREVIFNSYDSDLKTALSNWFAQEIAYLEKKLQLATVLPGGHVRQQTPQAAPLNTEPQKLLCTLSVDQLALILRAADDLKIVTVRSLNHLFKTIAPYLSTPYQENISYSSMRSKSYSAETRDKEIVMELLQKMVSAIREY